MKTIARSLARRLTAARCLAAVPLLAILPGVAHAQAGPLAPGEQVRISWWDPYVSSLAYMAPRMTTAEVVDLDGQALVLRRGNHIFRVPLGEVRSVQRRVGTRPASAPAMVAGSAGGFLAGFLLGSLTGGVEGGGADVDRIDAGITTGVLVGAPIGALVAWATSRSRGIFEDVPFGDLVNGVVADPDGRIGLSIRTGHR